MTDTTELQDGIEDLCDTANENLRGLLQQSERAQKAEAIASDLRKQNQELQIALSCMTASRDRWKAEAKGKITDEWRRRVADGDVGEVE